MTAVPDVFDPRRYARGLPLAEYRWLRDHRPVAWQPEYPVLGWPEGPGFWAVTRHADVVRVLKSPELFSSELGATQIRDPDPADLPFIRRMMLNQDPPGHGRLRRIVSGAFTPRRIERFAEGARSRARELLAGADREAHARPDGAVDLVHAVTDEYALVNLAELLGVPAADRGLLLRWTRQVIGYQDPDEAPEPPPLGPDGRPVNPRSPSALAEMFGYARALAEEKRARPADDLLTAVATELTGAELEMFFFLLVIAGNDTVRSAAPGALLALARHPAAWARLRDGRVPYAAAVEELLRVHPPVLSFRRTAAQDTELAGQRIRRGEKVVVFHASANHDERVFPAPEELRLDRAPVPHVSFGDGPHVCLGAHFARLQLRLLLAEAVRALPERLALGGEPRLLVSNFIHGVKSLPLRLA
ncbi:cytochrome P450 [Phaeacidiphilus oryzae]|uniref:cytochrome P450 n=1 Tax=Phaeacidiphilus oryzae TaxID=348818 RepID=UPI00055CBFE3|nr:cytochrome P450 [Phaeacidiphilus oryzae]